MSNTVPFLDLKYTYLSLQNELDAAYKKVMLSGRYILGEQLQQFEHAFAAFCQTKFALGVANGLQALELILKGYGIGAGDEVIVPAHTFIATWLAVSSVGATIIPVEPYPQTANLNVSAVINKISAKTKAIIPVHLYGQPVDMAPLQSLARQHDLLIIEDAAQAVGATYQGKKAGNLGNAAAFSLYPGKNLGAFGDGGVITTNDEKLYQKLKQLRNYGSSEKYIHPITGVNSRLDELQAAWCDVKLQHLNEWNAKRQAQAKLYQQLLSDNPYIKLPQVAQDSESVWHLFVIQTPHRSSLQHYLNQQNIQTLIHYPIPPHRQQACAAYAHLTHDLPLTEQLAEQVLSLPIGPHLKLQQIEQVAQAINAFVPQINKQSEQQYAAQQ